MLKTTDVLKKKLQPFVTENNQYLLTKHIVIFENVLNNSPYITQQSESLLINGGAALVSGDYWLYLEIESQYLSAKDGLLFRRCLVHFACAVDPLFLQPSKVKIDSVSIDCLVWFKRSRVLGKDIRKALFLLIDSTKCTKNTIVNYAQSALKCLQFIMDSNDKLALKLCDKGLISLGDAAQLYMLVQALSENNPHIKKTYKKLLLILSMIYPDQFKRHYIVCLGEQSDITVLYYLSPLCVEQLKEASTRAFYRGENGHNQKSVMKRFQSVVASLKYFFIDNISANLVLKNAGLNAFKKKEYSLIRVAKTQLTRYAFNELILLLSEYWEERIFKHQYEPYLLEFYYSKFDKYRVVDFSELAKKSPKLFEDICILHESETSLLLERDYDVITLKNRLGKLLSILINMVIPEHEEAANKLGLGCLSANNNKIQKSLFQEVQSRVQCKKMALSSGISYVEVVRWVMKLTGQKVIDVYRLSSKRYRRHAQRARMEDLYTDNEIRELVFHIEKGLKIAKDSKEAVALYFARIQLKTCWNISSLMDIQLSDISEVSLPTAKKVINILIQKPRKGYRIDCFHLDGRSTRSVMHDILYVRDILTKDFHQDKSGSSSNNYLFIYQEKNKIKRLDSTSVIYHINSILKRLGCSVVYNSMKIRKNGTNYIYTQVAKDIRDYESHFRHDFSTFIKNYQRIDEIKTQHTLHNAVDVMQKHFTGREINSDIKINMTDDFQLQKTPVGECASQGKDKEAWQYKKEHQILQKKNEAYSSWCSDYLACIWCKHFRTVADPEHVWLLLSYRDYVLADMSASISNIEDNQVQAEVISVLHERVDAILEQLKIKNLSAIQDGQILFKNKGLHPFWQFAITTTHEQGVLL